MSNHITIFKLDHTGRELFHYAGTVQSRTEHCVQLEAFFGLNDRATAYVVFRRGDRYTEWFYNDRWYNIFEIHNVGDDVLKGWYSNICMPAELGESEIRCRDLALDLWVDPTGKVTLLDEAEFYQLQLNTRTHYSALQAVQEVYGLVERREGPFGLIPR